MDAFDRHCDSQINATDDEAQRQMWNRAALKMMRVAALLAVADCYINPVVTDVHTAWATDLIMRDVALMQERIAQGDVGDSDDTRIKKIARILGDFLDGKVPASYNVPALMVRDGVVPRKYIQQRTAQLAIFNQHKLGAIGALNTTLRAMQDNGYIVEMDKVKAGAQYTFQGQCFRVVSLPALA